MSRLDLMTDDDLTIIATDLTDASDVMLSWAHKLKQDNVNGQHDEDIMFLKDRAIRYATTAMKITGYADHRIIPIGAQAADRSGSSTDGRVSA